MEKENINAIVNEVVLKKDTATKRARYEEQMRRQYNVRIEVCTYCTYGTYSMYNT